MSSDPGTHSPAGVDGGVNQFFLKELAILSPNFQKFKKILYILVFSIPPYMAKLYRSDYPDSQMWNHHLKNDARDEAYKRMWYDIYRHKMRYEIIENQHQLQLDKNDINEIQKYYRQLEDTEMSVKFVTVNLPQDAGLGEYMPLMRRCLKRRFVGQWHLAFERKHDPLTDTYHPHFHVIFTQTVKSLQPSRIRAEWSQVLQILPQYVNVRCTAPEQKSNLLEYISKDDFEKLNSEDLASLQYAKWKKASQKKKAFIKKAPAPKPSGEDSD